MEDVKVGVVKKLNLAQTLRMKIWKNLVRMALALVLDSSCNRWRDAVASKRVVVGESWRACLASLSFSDWPERE